FVISGFLITSLIWKDLETGHFTFARFWERRARRIVPALVVVVAAVLVAGWFLMLPADYERLGRSAASQAVFAANVHYWLAAGYFAPAAAEEPLLHTWSLALEEQFYWIVPLALFLVFAVERFRRRKTVLAGIACGIALSFALSVWGVARHPSAAFYLLPTRAWELLSGSLVAFMPAPSAGAGRRALRELAAIGAVALILLAAFGYRPTTPFPGAAALAPCLGAALWIRSNSRRGNEKSPASPAPTLAGSLLSRPLPVFIGLASYSLYLWHWPFLAFARYLSLDPLAPGIRLALVGGSAACAVLCWKYVETPFRKRSRAASGKAMFSFAAAALAGILAVGIASSVTAGFPFRIPAAARIFAAGALDRAFIRDVTPEDVLAGRLVRIGAAGPDLRPTVLVWGDSHAMAVLPAIDALLKERGVSGRAVTYASTAPVFDWFLRTEWGLHERSVGWNESVLAYVRKQRIADVVLSASWSGYMQETGNATPFGPALVETVRRLAAAGVRPWVLLDVPIQTFNVPRALAFSVMFHTDVDGRCRKALTSAQLVDFSNPGIIGRIEAAGGRVLDPKPSFLDARGDHYVVQKDGVALYQDNGHLSSKGAKRVLLPYLRGAFRPGDSAKGSR
ncbi:MAG TPA: acyltransferase family protein, partial [Thermoanaerobaculia bacterium]